jgi:LPS export ABC transporter protein LptC
MIKQFIFMVCLIAITGSFLLLWESPPESFSRPDTSKIEELPSADSYMSNIKSLVFSNDGNQQYLLEASKISIYSRLSKVKLSEPTFIAYQNNDNSHFFVKADRGDLSKITKIFEFNGDVNAKWENVKGKTDLNADSLSYSLNEESATASGGVKVTTHNTQITGDSLSVNFPNQLLKIESRVRGSHDSI